MKNVLATVFFVLGMVFMAQAQESPKGVWMIGKEDVKVEVYEEGDSWYGKVIEVKGQKPEEERIMLKDFKKNGDVYEGKLFSAKKKKWMDAKMNPKGDVLEMTVSVGFMSKTLEWTKSE